MNKNTLNKIGFFLSVLVERYQNGEKYFLGMDISYKSGTKLFPAEVRIEDGQLIFVHSAEKKPFEWDDIKNAAANYDSMRLVYKERGTNAVLTADDRNVAIKYEDSQENEKSTSSVVQSGRNYLIKPPKANALLKEIGIMSETGKIKNDMIRKYNQIDHFVELVSGYLKRLDGEVEVLDCACGKSYLSFALNYYLRDILKKDCHVTGVDYSDIVIRDSKRAAEHIGYGNMTFIKADLTDFKPMRKPDVVISLHACDTATDMAIAAGINSGAKAIFAVPCCHKELLGQYSYPEFDPILKHGIFKARMADLLTDGLRCLLLEAFGYSVSANEYISPVETPKNLLIRAFKDGKRQKEAKEEYFRLKDALGVTPKLETLIDIKR